MAREYSTQASRRTQSPPWIWFFIGALVGGMGTGLLCLKQGGPTPQPVTAQCPTTEVKPPQPIPAQPVTPPTQAPEPDKPKKFDFYSVLPEQEVVIPEQEIAKPAPTVAPAPQKPPVDTAAGQSVFLLQVGSFRTPKEADRLRANLALLGVQAEIQSVTISGPTGQNTVHRVRSGPYNRNQAYDMHETLKNNKINSIVIRIQE